MASSKNQFVVVTTAHRGVFGGYLNGAQDRNSKVLELTDCQMCVYWSADVQGVLGLAASGPSKTCKVTPSVPKMVLQDITSVMDATGAAETAWLGKPWR